MTDKNQQTQQEGRPRTIHTLWRCSRCVATGLRDDFDVGVTPTGLQVWCRHHDMEVILVTPETLQFFIDRGPQCEICDAQGKHTH